MCRRKVTLRRQDGKEDVQWFRDILLLSAEPNYQDVELVCEDGKLTCNSLILSVLSPSLAFCLSELVPVLDSSPTILLPDNSVHHVRMLFEHLKRNVAVPSHLYSKLHWLHFSRLSVSAEVLVSDVWEEMSNDISSDCVTVNNEVMSKGCPSTSQNKELSNTTLELLASNMTVPLVLEPAYDERCDGITGSVNNILTSTDLTLPVAIKSKPGRGDNLVFNSIPGLSTNTIGNCSNSREKLEPVDKRDAAGSLTVGRKQQPGPWEDVPSESLVLTDTDTVISTVPVEVTIGTKDAPTCESVESGFLLSKELCDKTKKSSRQTKKAVRAKIKKDPLCSWRCDECGKVLSDRNCLLRHERTVHSRHRPHHCPECTKSFFLANDLKQHVNIVHRKIRCFVCEICGLALTTQKVLASHVLTHDGGASKQRACPQCGKTFRHRSTLTKHQKRIHDFDPSQRLPCHLCNRLFNHQEGLTRHLISVHRVAANTGGKSRHDLLPAAGGMAQHDCPLCHRNYAFRYELNRHLRRAHHQQPATSQAGDAAAIGRVVEAVEEELEATQTIFLTTSTNGWELTEQFVSHNVIVP